MPGERDGPCSQPTREAADRASSVVAAAASSYLATALVARRWAFRAAGQATRKAQKAGAAENGRCGRTIVGGSTVTVAVAGSVTVAASVAMIRIRDRDRDRPVGHGLGSGHGHGHRSCRG